MNTEDFLKQFTPRNKTTGFDLSKTNMRKQELAFLDLSMNFRGSNLSDAILESVEWNGIDLTGANLSGAFFECANLIGADLRNADLSNTRLGSASFERACLDGANLTNAYFVQASLEGASLKGAILTGANFDAANLTRADLRGAVDANLTCARLAYTILPNGIVVTEENRGIEREYCSP